MTTVNQSTTATEKPLQPRGGRLSYDQRMALYRAEHGATEETDAERQAAADMIERGFLARNTRGDLELTRAGRAVRAGATP